MLAMNLKQPACMALERRRCSKAEVQPCRARTEYTFKWLDVMCPSSERMAPCDLEGVATRAGDKALLGLHLLPHRWAFDLGRYRRRQWCLDMPETEAPSEAGEACIRCPWHDYSVRRFGEDIDVS